MDAKKDKKAKVAPELPKFKEIQYSMMEDDGDGGYFQTFRDTPEEVIDNAGVDTATVGVYRLDGVATVKRTVTVVM